MTCLKWKDKKEVGMISTVHCVETVTVTRNGIEKVKPQVVVDYNNKMGGVDRVDQHLADYTIPRKRGRDTTKKIFFHILNLSLWNSYVLYLKLGERKSHLDFRMNVVKEIMEKYKTDFPSPKYGRPISEPSPLRLSVRHFPEYLPATEKKNKSNQAMCSRVPDCNGKKLQRESRYFCPDCDVALCVSPCFRVYHTVANI
jgi:hypothetical protein